jgi:hypothetical protein
LYIKDDESTYINMLLNTFLAAILTFLILFVIGYLLNFVPNEISYEYIKTTFVVDINQFNPEAPERLKYIILTVLFPLLFTALFRLSGKLKKSLSHKKVITYSLLVLSFLWLFCTILISMLEIQILSYYTSITIIFCLFMLALLCLSIRIKFRDQKKISCLCLILCILSAIFISSLYVRKVYGFNYWEFYNFDAYYYPVFEVFYGKILAVDFHNNYGFYPYILAPIFKLTGSITIFKFSIATAIMIFMILLSFLYVIWTNTRNKIICLIGYLALLCCYFILPLQLTHRFYHAYLPHRVLFPAIIILIGNLYLNTPRKKIWVVIGFVITCLSVVWNFDTGFVVAGSWCLFLLYVNAIKYSLKDSRFYAQAFKYVGLSILSIAFAFLFIIGVTYFKSGSLIAIHSLFFSQSVFYKYGFYMEPMPRYHIWIALVFIYVIGLIISLRKIALADIHADGLSSKQASVYFLLSVTGMGIFSYYQGRSLDPVFLAVVWPGIIMAVLLTQHFFDKAMLIYKSAYIQKKTLFIAHMLQSCSFLVILIPFFIAFPNITICDDYFRPMLDLTCNTYYSQVDVRYKILESNLDKKEQVALFILQPAYYYTMLGMSNPSNIGSCVDWFTRADYDKALTWLRTTKNVVILDENMRSLLINYNSDEFHSIMNTFKVKKIGSNLYMCTRL